MITLQADNIRRLNMLLELTHVTVDALDQSEWNQLLNGLYWAVLGEKTSTNPDDEFSRVVSPHSVRAAQEGLRGKLSLLQNAKPSSGLFLENVPCFELEKQKVYLFTDREGFFPRYLSRDFPTMAYQTLIFLIDRLKLRPSDFLSCANKDCERVFVPLRRPHKAHKRNFCSQKCGNLIAAREYRKENAAAERERSHQRYVKKVHQRHPKVRIARRPRKQPKR